MMASKFERVQKQEGKWRRAVCRCDRSHPDNRDVGPVCTMCSVGTKEISKTWCLSSECYQSGEHKVEKLTVWSLWVSMMCGSDARAGQRSRLGFRFLLCHLQMLLDISWGLCPDQPIINWKYRKRKMHLIHLPTKLHSSLSLAYLKHAQKTCISLQLGRII